MLILVASSCKLLKSCLSTWGWPSGLEHNSRFWGFSYKRLVVQVTTRFAVEDFFSYKLFHARKRKIKYWRVTSKRSTRFGVEFFCPTSCSSQEREGFFYRRATYRGKYGKAKEDIGPARAGWSPHILPDWTRQVALEDFWSSVVMPQ